MNHCPKHIIMKYLILNLNLNNYIHNCEISYNVPAWFLSFTHLPIALFSEAVVSMAYIGYVKETIRDTLRDRTIKYSLCV